MWPKLLQSYSQKQIRRSSIVISLTLARFFPCQQCFSMPVSCRIYYLQCTQYYQLSLLSFTIYYLQSYFIWIRLFQLRSAFYSQVCRPSILSLSFYIICIDYFQRCCHPQPFLRGFTQSTSEQLSQKSDRWICYSLSIYYLSSTCYRDLRNLSSLFLSLISTRQYRSIWAIFITKQSASLDVSLRVSKGQSGRLIISSISNQWILAYSSSKDRLRDSYFPPLILLKVFARLSSLSPEFILILLLGILLQNRISLAESRSLYYELRTDLYSFLSPSLNLSSSYLSLLLLYSANCSFLKRSSLLLSIGSDVLMAVYNNTGGRLERQRGSRMKLLVIYGHFINYLLASAVFRFFTYNQSAEFLRCRAAISYSNRLILVYLSDNLSSFTSNSLLSSTTNLLSLSVSYLNFSCFLGDYAAFNLSLSSLSLSSSSSCCILNVYSDLTLSVQAPTSSLNLPSSSHFFLQLSSSSIILPSLSSFSTLLLLSISTLNLFFVFAWLNFRFSFKSIMCQRFTSFWSFFLRWRSIQSSLGSIVPFMKVVRCCQIRVWWDVSVSGVGMHYWLASDSLMPLRTNRSFIIHTWNLQQLELPIYYYSLRFSSLILSSRQFFQNAQSIPCRGSTSSTSNLQLVPISLYPLECSPTLLLLLTPMIFGPSQLRCILSTILWLECCICLMLVRICQKSLSSTDRLDFCSRLTCFFMWALLS